MRQRNPVASPMIGHWVCASCQAEHSGDEVPYSDTVRGFRYCGEACYRSSERIRRIQATGEAVDDEAAPTPLFPRRRRRMTSSWQCRGCTGLGSSGALAYLAYAEGAEDPAFFCSEVCATGWETLQQTISPEPASPEPLPLLPMQYRSDFILGLTENQLSEITNYGVAEESQVRIYILGVPFKLKLIEVSPHRHPNNERGEYVSQICANGQDACDQLDELEEYLKVNRDQHMIQTVEIHGTQYVVSLVPNLVATHVV